MLYGADMARSSENTKKRILAAAMNEFAAYGIAGARIERIATEAQCNKQAIYLYFENKDGLAEAVYRQMVDDFMDAVPFDAEDLLGYVQQLRKRYNSHPKIRRLDTWFTLEKGNSTRMPCVKASMSQKLDLLRQAQEKGSISKRYSPEILYLLIMNLARCGLNAEVNSITLDSPYTFNDTAIYDIIGFMTK